MKCMLKKKETEAELDIKCISNEHYLLEAGKNQWRLNDSHYSDSNALLLYALGLLCNNSFSKHTQEELNSLETRMRLSYLLYSYSDEDKAIEERYQQLVDTFSKRIKKLPKKLQEKYKLNVPDVTLLKKIKKLLFKSKSNTLNSYTSK